MTNEQLFTFLSLLASRGGWTGDGVTGIRGWESAVEEAGSGDIWGGGGRRGGGKRGESGVGSFYKSLKGVRHVLNPNAKLAYKRLFWSVL